MPTTDLDPIRTPALITAPAQTTAPDSTWTTHHLWGHGIWVVRENHAGANEKIVLDDREWRYVRHPLYLAVSAYLDAVIQMDLRADLRPIPDLSSIAYIGKMPNFDIFTDFYSFTNVS